MYAGLLLVPQERVEEGVDQLGAGHGLVAMLRQMETHIFKKIFIKIFKLWTYPEERLQEPGDVLLPPLRHLPDLLPPQVDEAGLAQAGK